MFDMWFWCLHFYLHMCTVHCVLIFAFFNMFVYMIENYTYIYVYRYIDVYIATVGLQYIFIYIYILYTLVDYIYGVKHGFKLDFRFHSLDKSFGMEIQEVLETRHSRWETGRSPLFWWVFKMWFHNLPCMHHLWHIATYNYPFLWYG